MFDSFRFSYSVSLANCYFLCCSRRIEYFLLQLLASMVYDFFRRAFYSVGHLSIYSFRRNACFTSYFLLYICLMVSQAYGFCEYPYLILLMCYLMVVVHSGARFISYFRVPGQAVRIFSFTTSTGIFYWCSCLFVLGRPVPAAFSVSSATDSHSNVLRNARSLPCGTCLCAGTGLLAARFSFLFVDSCWNYSYSLSFLSPLSVSYYVFPARIDHNPVFILILPMFGKTRCTSCVRTGPNSQDVGFFRSSWFRVRAYPPDIFYLYSIL